MNKNKKHTKSYIIIFIFTAIVLYFALKDNYKEIYNELSNMNVWWLVIAVIFIIIYWSFKALILLICSRNFNPKFTFKKAYIVNLETMFFNAITPFSSGGQPFQMVCLKEEGLKMSESSSVVLFDTLIFQLSQGFICIMTLILNLFMHTIPMDSIFIKFIIIVFVVKIVLCTLILLLLFNNRFNRCVLKVCIKILNIFKIVKNRKETIDKIDSSLDNYNRCSKVIINNKKDFMKMFWLNSFAFIFYYTIPYFLMIGIGLNSFNILDSFVISSFVINMGSFVPIPGGTGGMEYFFVLLFSYKMTSGVNTVMLLWRVVIYYFGLIVGALTINIRKRLKEKE